MWHRLILSLSPILYQCCLHGSWLIAYVQLGRAPDANRHSVMHVWGGAFHWLGLALMLLSVLVIPTAIRWGRSDKQWRYLRILLAGWAVMILLLALDPLGARAWFMY